MATSLRFRYIQRCYVRCMGPSVWHVRRSLRVARHTPRKHVNAVNVDNILMNSYLLVLVRPSGECVGDYGIRLVTQTYLLTTNTLSFFVLFSISSINEMFCRFQVQVWLRCCFLNWGLFAEFKRNTIKVTHRSVCQRIFHETGGTNQIIDHNSLTDPLVPNPNDAISTVIWSETWMVTNWSNLSFVCIIQSSWIVIRICL